MRSLIGLLFLISVIAGLPAWAADRAVAVHARIDGSLSKILHSSDYLVIVNRLDQLEDGGESSAASGQVRRLPGLGVGVDAAGRVIRSDETAGQYNGGVSIAVMVDPAVKADTYTLIERSIPELAGGLRDSDEFRISRAVLRQPPVPNGQAPQVAINNSLPDRNTSVTDLLRQVAIGLALLGLFVWVLSRLLDRERRAADASAPSRASAAERENSAEAESQRQRTSDQFAELDPHVTGLYLIRAESNRQMDRVRTWAHGTDPATHRTKPQGSTRAAARAFELVSLDLSSRRITSSAGLTAARISFGSVVP
jgi:hypothetical protein